MTLASSPTFEGSGGVVGYETMVFGQYGAVAGVIRVEDKHPQWWGTPDGLDLWTKEFGRDSLTVEGMSG